MDAETRALMSQAPLVCLVAEPFKRMGSVMASGRTVLECQERVDTLPI